VINAIAERDFETLFTSVGFFVYKLWPSPRVFGSWPYNAIGRFTLLQQFN
jgi:hypothetical protein